MSRSVETTQVKLALVPENHQHELSDDTIVKGVNVHNQMKANKVWQKDEAGPYVPLMFSGHEFRFRPGRPLQFDKTVAQCLLRDSHVIVGPKDSQLTNPSVPYLYIVAQYEMGADPEPNIPTICGVCNEDLRTLPRLARHYAKHKAEKPELFKSDLDSEEIEDEKEVTA